MERPADRAHEIVFGHWKAEFSSWFASSARHPSVFAASRVLYRDLTGSAEKLAELFGILDDSDKVHAFRADAAPAGRTHAQAWPG